MGDPAAYEEFFREADVNGDGHLSFTELETVLKKHGYTGSDQEIKVMHAHSFPFCLSSFISNVVHK